MDELVCGSYEGLKSGGTSFPALLTIEVISWKP